MQGVEQVQNIKKIKKADLPQRTISDFFPVLETHIPKDKKIAIAVSG